MTRTFVHRSLAIHFSRFSFAGTLVYHTISALSTLFLLSPCDLYILSHLSTFVNTFFHFFKNFFVDQSIATTLTILSLLKQKVNSFFAKKFLLIILTKNSSFIHYLLTIFTLFPFKRLFKLLVIV